MILGAEEAPRPTTARGAVPSFDPHPLVSGGHAQSWVGYLLPGPKEPMAVRRDFEIALLDGDRLLCREDQPVDWTAGAPQALLVHGLGGSVTSDYCMRLTVRLTAMNVRVVRMNLRNAGPSLGLSRLTYHAGLTSDVRAVAERMTTDGGAGSPLALVGFSLGANLVLKLAGEASTNPLVGLDAVVAASPPLDLEASCRHLMRPGGRFYDRRFARALRDQVDQLHRTIPDLGPTGLDEVDSVFGFDDAYTAPRHGFRNAVDYYRQSSAIGYVDAIEVDGLVVHAEDDPFVAFEPFTRASWSRSLEVDLNSRGGHLGFVHRRRVDGTHRWLDVRIADWLARHWRLSTRAEAGPHKVADR